MKKTDKEHQKDFFDQHYGLDRRRSVSKFYVITSSSRGYYEKLLLSAVLKLTNDINVLEYGCGKGSYAFFLAKYGVRVVGIDISEVGIRLAQERADCEGLKNVKFLVMDAEEMEFENNSFDLVCGTGILHHLDLNKALKELVRVLKPEGKAIFVEPLGHNPIINLYRKLTPSLRTKDEHPF